MKKPFAFTALLLALPMVAGAQAIRCTDAATGKVLYTDQPCKNGQTVVPKRSEDELRQDALAAEQARARHNDEREQTQWREQQRREAARQEAAARAAPVTVAESADCRAARAEADFRARSNTATPEQIRTARYNAALACGQQPPSDVVVVQPEPWGAVPPPMHRRPRPGWGEGGWYPPPPSGPPVPQRPSFSGGTQDNRAIPVAPVSPSVQARPSSSGIHSQRRLDDPIPVAPGTSR